LAAIDPHQNEIRQRDSAFDVFLSLKGGNFYA
jgi:hypothetical protein